MEPHKRRAVEMAGLLQEHRARVALLPPHVYAHSLMPAAEIYRATQNNLVRAQGLADACKAYAKAVEATRACHLIEEAKERGAPVSWEVSGERSTEQ